MYVALRSFDPASRGSWSLFSVALITVGVLAVFIALLPGSWVRKAFKIEPAKSTSVHQDARRLCRRFLPPDCRTLLRTAQLASQLPVCVFPMSSVRFNHHCWPSLGTVLLGLAPLSAAVYGSLGGVLGYASVILRKGN